MENHPIVHLYKDAPIKKIIRKPHIIYNVPKDHKELNPEIRNIWRKLAPKDIEFVFYDEYIEGININPNSILDDYIQEAIGPCFLTFEEKDDNYYNFAAVIIEGNNYAGSLRAILEILNKKISENFYPKKDVLPLPRPSAAASDMLSHMPPHLSGLANAPRPGIGRPSINQKIKAYFESEDIYEEEKPELKKALKLLYSQFGANALDKLLLAANDNQDIEPYSLVIDEQGDFYLENDDVSIEISLNALQKTLYLLFLRHKEGLIFDEIQNYFAEALNIYMAIKSEKDPFPIGINKASNKYTYAADICKKQRSVLSLIGGGEYQVPEYFDRFTNIDRVEKKMSSQFHKSVTTIRKIFIKATQGKDGLCSFYLIEKQGRGRYSIQISSMPDKLIWHKSKRFPTNIFDPEQDNSPYYAD